MKNVNELVLKVQTEGNESYAYVELFEIINKETIEPKARSFAKQVKGQVEESISIGYGLLMELVESWNGTGNFHTLFKTSYNNRLINHVKYVARDKRKQDTGYSVSLSESSKAESGEPSPMLEVTTIEALQSFDNMDNLMNDGNTLEALMIKFATEYPKQSEIINIASSFSEDMKQVEKSNVYCAYFGVQAYTEIQKKVSRAKETFMKFLVKNDYQTA